jgi:purine nucleosidase
MEKVLLDTDIGSDIDDAVCLAYLLANPQCELLGVTTVSGEALQRARLASVLCRVAGKSIPIYPGVSDPILQAPRQVRAQQAEALSRWPHQKEFPQGQAIAFLRDMIRANPGEVTLLTIGPLTNLGLLFVIDPEIPALLKRLVMMCGVYTNHLPNVGPLEWNAMLDPHATAVAFRARPAVHRSVGLDVTCQVRMSAEQVRRRFQPDLLRPVLDFAEVWFREVQQITFHDPLAAVTIFDDQVCRFERGLVEVELTSPRLSGFTVWTPNLDGPHEIAMSVSAERFFDMYFSVFE